ncbi:MULTISPECIES: MFS transporter [Bradyrhizobium]|uniref:MFS transporter, DHA1 family, arabinose polymer transporter n=1 Tax=Bradyrhizobium yuanmingense TaxID=108015 RepID=A0A1C3WPN6_9BRAD|nr:MULTISPECIES: MFS transporter [Bradyrhizobium]MCA1386283.1 MFS transporter [Bradyrhizobium sp. BRP05]MCA1423255.1 MFS transporter [Bradyrhizobium sp. BRP23]TWI24295.1 DHA1 family inner membrane transport protein [Bradyrhizobium yuanmingense]SCB41674.1 MFS transporter, DHA1 family, arabinose polymer transporter [Bradyrhizobium yuanmingense]
MPPAVLALTAGAFGIGTTEFIIMGLLLQVAADMHVSVPVAGLLISGYALGVFVGAPVLTLATRRLPRKTVLLALMAIFTLGNAACALAPTYELLMAARVLTSLAHGTFFGVGSVVATSLVAEDKRASAIATMFIGLTVATLLGVPFGAWLGLMLGWRAAFWAVTVIGVIAFAVVAALVPGRVGDGDKPISLAEEVAVLGRPQVLLGLAMTVFGFAGLFVVFTYIQPILTRFTGFSEAAVSPILLVFGVGLGIGNIAGGKLADRGLARALTGTLAALAIVLLGLAAVLSIKILSVALILLLGTAAFATVAPLQLRVLEAAGPSGRTLASSLNIAAFNLGNALGAWVGGVTIARGLGLSALPLVAAGITVIGLVLALWSLRLDRAPATVAACPAE